MSRGNLRLAGRVLEDFVAHHGLVRAASLSYTTLLALVPLLALVVSVSKGVVKNQEADFLPRLVDRVLTYAVPQIRYLSEEEAESARNDVLVQLEEAIERVNAGALGLFGALTLVSVAITLLAAVEDALNNVWGVEAGRSWPRRIAYYWAGVTLGPVLVFFSIGLSSSAVAATILGALPGGFAEAVFRLFLPFLVLGAGFTLLYRTMPNTAVPFRPALIGGITAGTLFQLNNLLSALYFSQVVTYSRVYGGVAAVPVLMVGLYFAWTIVLVGAEVAYALATPGDEPRPYPEGSEDRARLALEIARRAAESFLAGRGGVSATDLAEALRVPPDWVNRTLSALCRGGVLVPTERDASDDSQALYVPARPPASVGVLDVVDLFRKAGETVARIAVDPAIDEVLRTLREAETEAAAAVTLERLARREEGAA